MDRRPGVLKVMRSVLAKAMPDVDGFATDVGVSRATLYYWGNGKRNPSPANLARLADALERRSADLAELAVEVRKTASAG